MIETAVLELPGMPGPWQLRRVESQGRCVVLWGRKVVFEYMAEDTGMRNLALVAATNAGARVDEAARVFGVSATYASMLRSRARAQGAAGLVKAMGRPPKLTGRQVQQVRRWAGQDFTQQEIAERVGVAQSQISVLLSRHGAIAPQDELPTAQEEIVEPFPTPDAILDATPKPGVAGGRSGQGLVRSRYAGAMLGHAFLARANVPAIFAALRTQAARRVDDASLLTAVTLAFGLGISCLEGAKLLNRREAGALSGLRALPELRTLRPQLAAIADSCDPLAVQRDLAAAMLEADAPALGVYYVDDHFVSYAGAKPLGRGFNNKRKQAQKGHGDTLVTDHRGRAVAFITGEPSGLTKTLPDALEQLRAITGPDTKLMLGFDRGGAYASVFKVCRAFETEWITYRRGKLKTTLIKPTAHPYPPTEAEAEAETETGTCEVVHLSDELVEFKNYGVCRQLTLFEDGVVKLQVLTSDMSADAVSLLSWLRSRWRIENAFKDLSRLYGIDWLCDYRAEEIDDTTAIDNPARAAALAHLKDREKELATAERALARLVESPERPISQVNKKIPAARRAVGKATAARDAAKQTHKETPAKIAVNELKPGQQRSLPAIGRRTFQMVLRMLAYNSELFLADRLNAYLRDDNEYRTLTRSLFQLHGDLDYQPGTITVTLDPPDSPRLTRALTLLIDEINHTPPHLPGDPRPITYKIKSQQRS